ncbi:hypothetical protein ACFOY2_02385 [Nonomuraea purpurea]|uniref:WXG100 family type VII secretion target n=1 Tax=Nonomuraea purpurea TaxID=1849276 RepID=A0ABV8G0K7_9ACTN
MTDFWEEALKDPRAPQPDGVRPLYGGDSDSSAGIAALIEDTKPELIAQAGKNYQVIAGMCRDSVEKLSQQAQIIAKTMGGDSAQGVLNTINELQQDLARIYDAASSVGRPLEWYGSDVLPWFQRNVPRTGSMSIDDDLFDGMGAVEDNAHAIARHHLQLLNAFMGDAYNAMNGYVEQSATAPQTGLPGTGLGSGLGGIPPGGLPGGSGSYPGAGLSSPYGSPDLNGLTGPKSGLDVPGTQTPGFGDPSRQDPSLQPPQTTVPGSPDMKNPDMKTPDVKTPDLNTPDLPQTPSTTNLANVPQPPSLGGQPPQTQTGLPVGGPGPPSGTSPVTQLGAAAGGPAAGAGSTGASGMPMGMVPPMGGAANGGQERERERARASLVEDEAFDSDDMGGPSVIA